MGTKVVLKKDVEKLGRAGTLVEVAPGYARNYLIPQGLALRATPGLIKQAEERMAKLRAIEAQQRAEALETRKTLESVGFYEISATVGEDGQQLFGSVTNQDIAEAIAAKTQVTIDRREIEIDEPIRRTGVYTVQVRVFRDVFATVRVQVNPAG